MLKFLFTSLIFFYCSLSAFASEDFLKMFKERSKTTVSVEFIFQLEEDRQKWITSGMVASDDGIIILPESEVPVDARIDELKDFKVFTFSGDEDGYPAEYLGCDNVSGTHFLKLKAGKLPECMTPFCKFKISKPLLGESIWGVGISSERNAYEHFFQRANVSITGRYPLHLGECDAAVTAIGGAIFNASGDFVGWGLGASTNAYLLNFAEEKSYDVTLVNRRNSSSFLLPEEVEKILKSIPSNPNGDKYGWLGFVDIVMLKKDVAKFMGLEKKPAFVLSGVIKNSPAEKAGFEKGDIIIGQNSKDIERLNSDSSTLSNFILNLKRVKVGEKISFNIIRGDKPMVIDVTTMQSPKTYRQSSTKYFKRLGFSIREYLLMDSFVRKILDNDIDAAVVQFVKPNSPASSATPTNLSPRDVIKEINSVPIKSYKEAVDMLEKINGDTSEKEVVILAEDFNETKVIRIKLD